MLADLDACIDGTTARATATAAIVAGTVLYASSDGLRPCLSLFPDQAQRAVGLAETSAQAGDEVLVVLSGVWRGTTPWPAGTPLFLGPDGFPTPDPDSGLVCLPLGHVHGPGVLHVRLGLPITHQEV